MGLARQQLDALDRYAVAAVEYENAQRILAQAAKRVVDANRDLDRFRVPLPAFTITPQTEQGVTILDDKRHISDYETTVREWVLVEKAATQRSEDG